MTIREHTHFIGGRFVDGSDAEFIERVSPANGQAVAKFARGTTADIDLAVESARFAFDDGVWPRLSGMERANVLHRWADLIGEHQDMLVRIEVEEVGKPIRFARGDIAGAIGLIRYAASLRERRNGHSPVAMGERAWK